MREQPQDIQEWIKELISRSAKDQFYNLKRFETLIQRAYLGEIDQNNLRNEYLDFAKKESMRYVNDLIRVGLSFYNTVLDLNSRYNDRFFKQAFHEKNNNLGSTPGGKPRGKIETLELRGKLGEYAERSFTIENQSQETAEVSFLVSEFENTDGVLSFRPPVQITPPRFTLRPGEEQVINLKIPLLKEVFSSGKECQARIAVSGFENIQFLLKVSADEYGSDATEKPKSKSARKTAVTSGEAETETKQRDDFTKIKGIGKVYQERLREIGIDTFTRLAQIEESEIEASLGKRMASQAKNNQWQDQAKIAAGADWDGLLRYQKSMTEKGE
jgi:predicted flap endonuclease-1-like 5' DNA nuclease